MYQQKKMFHVLIYLLWELRKRIEGTSYQNLVNFVKTPVNVSILIYNIVVLLFVVTHLKMFV